MDAPFAGTDLNDGITLLWYVSERLLSPRHQHENLQGVLVKMAQTLRLSLCSLFLLDKKEGDIPRLKIAGEVYPSNAAMSGDRFLEGMVERSMRERQVLVENHNNSLISIPLIIGRKAIGVILCCTERGVGFSDPMVKVLRTAANQIAIGIGFSNLKTSCAELEKERTERILIERAKGLLMEEKGLTEKEAYQLLRESSMNQQKPLGELAEAVLVAFSQPSLTIS